MASLVGLLYLYVLEIVEACQMANLVLRMGISEFWTKYPEIALGRPKISFPTDGPANRERPIWLFLTTTVALVAIQLLR